VTKR